MCEPYEFKEQLFYCFRDKQATSNEQRLSFFLENYFSDATEKKSSANHSLNKEGIYDYKKSSRTSGMK